NSSHQSPRGAPVASGAFWSIHHWRPVKWRGLWARAVRMIASNALTAARISIGDLRGADSRLSATHRVVPLRLLPGAPESFRTPKNEAPPKRYRKDFTNICDLIQ